MNKQLAFLTGIAFAAVMAVAGPAKAQSASDDPIAALAQELKLTQAQKKQMRERFFQFLETQDQVPTPGQVVLDNRSTLREIITDAKFSDQKAQAFVQKVTAVIEKATVNRMHLRHDLYQMLTPEQQKQYLDIVQKAVEQGLE